MPKITKDGGQYSLLSASLSGEEPEKAEQEGDELTEREEEVRNRQFPLRSRYDCDSGDYWGPGFN